MELVKVIKTKATIEGLSKAVLVSIEIESDDADFSYWDADLAKQTKIDLEANRVNCVWVKVTARFADLSHYEGQDSLGQVFVRSTHAMAKKDVLQTVQTHEMMVSAIEDLVAQVLQGKSQIDTFLGKAA